MKRRSSFKHSLDKRGGSRKSSCAACGSIIQVGMVLSASFARTTVMTSSPPRVIWRCRTVTISPQYGW
jgi:hypothetical protein